MNQPKTKREAERMILDVETRVERAALSAEWSRGSLGAARKDALETAQDGRAEAARLRALLPTLPDHLPAHDMDHCPSGGCLQCDDNPYDRSP